MHSPGLILVAEDNDTEALILRMAAEKAGIEKLFFVRDGDDLISYLTGQPPYTDRAQYPFPALLIIDLKMPRMTGFEVLSWLATRPDLKNLPAVILSSSSHEPDIAKALALGAREFHMKPHTLPQLCAILSQLSSRWLK